MATIQSPMHRQNGAVTLVITLLVMIALTIGSFALVQTGTMEKRMTANDQRSRTAFQAAQSGIDFLMAHLSQSVISVDELCTSGNWRDSGFLLSFTGYDDSTKELDFNPVTQSEACFATPFAMLQTTNVWSRGFSDDRESVRTLVSTIDLTRQWDWKYEPGNLIATSEGTGAIISGGMVTVGGTFETGQCEREPVDNCLALSKPSTGSGGNRLDYRDLNEGQVYISAGVGVDASGNTSVNEGNWEIDPTLSSMDGEQMFLEFVSGAYETREGEAAKVWGSLADYKAEAEEVTVGKGGKPKIGDGPLYFVEGDLKLTNQEIGGPNNPVLLVITGSDIKITGNAAIWGTVVVLGDVGDKKPFNAGTAAIIGSLITPLDVDATGNMGVYFNADAASDPIVRLAVENDPDSPAAVVTLRVGSWREVTGP